jgi:hypothetical protein
MPAASTILIVMHVIVTIIVTSPHYENILGRHTSMRASRWPMVDKPSAAQRPLIASLPAMSLRNSKKPQSGGLGRRKLVKSFDIFTNFTIMNRSIHLALPIFYSPG